MANTIRAAYQTMGSTLALQIITTYGDSVTYVNGADATSSTIYALVLPGEEMQSFGPDTNRMSLLVPYQTGFTACPPSGSTITIDNIKFAVESSNADDGEYPVTFELRCFRWCSAQPEIQ